MRVNWMAVILLGVPLASCQTYGNDQMSQYLQRKDGVTLSAGDAQQVNIAAQTLHPWPPGVGDRRIPMEGTRAVRTIATYNCTEGAPLKTTGQASTVSAGGVSITASKSETKKDC